MGKYLPSHALCCNAKLCDYITSKGCLIFMNKMLWGMKNVQVSSGPLWIVRPFVGDNIPVCVLINFDAP